MKIVTAIPAEVARTLDIVDRDVTSVIEVFQESLYPLPPLPSRLQLFPSLVGSGTTITTSFVMQHEDVVANAVAISRVLGRLGPGVWTIRLQLCAFFNYFLSGADDGVDVNADLDAPACKLIRIGALGNGTGISYSLGATHRILVPAAGMDLNWRMGANGVGQVAVGQLVLSGEKYL